MLRSNNLWNLMPCLLNVQSFLTSSDLISWQLLLEIAHCIPLSLQSVSSHLTSSPQFISTYQMSSHFFHLISSNPISCLLSLSQLFSADHNYSHRFSCHLSFSHLISAYLSSNAISPFRSPKPAPKTDLDATASNSYAFYREDFTQKTFIHSKLLHRETWTHRSFYTELGKFFFTAKLSHTASSHTENFLHAETFARNKFLHTANFYTQEVFTQRI